MLERFRVALVYRLGECCSREQFSASRADTTSACFFDFFFVLSIRVFVRQFMMIMMIMMNFF